MLAGKLPFRADHEAALMYMILHTEPEGLGREVPGEPAGLQDLLRLMLEKDRSRRPSSATDVLRALRTMAEATEAPGSASAARRQQSIAVLPLANLSPDPENEFFSDGMTEEIAASLSRLKQLQVCSRSMSLQYKGKLIDPRTVGRDLAVDFIVEGSVRRIGTRVRMNVELTDTRTGFQVWAQSYDRQIEDVFAVQDEVSRTIADSLKLHLTGTDHDGLRRKYTANPAAYDEYLRGRFLWNKRRREDVLEAIAHYRNAMNIDTNYTLAYTGLAICYSALSNYGWMDSSEARRLGTEVLEKAIDLEPDLDEVHMVKGEFAFTDSDLDEADRHYRRAIQQNPSNAVAHHWYAYVHLCRADFQTALYENDAALQLEPLSPIINAYRGFILFCQGNFREAHECMSRAVRFDDTFGQGHHLAAWVLAWMDQYPKALESVSRGERAWGDNNHLLCVKAVIQARQGDREGAGDVLAQLSRRREEGVYVHPFDFALVHAAMGDADAMFRNLREACDVRFYWWFVTLRVHPVFAPYREDFRFREILTLLRLK
jgi:serine/threonine-protein kinase